MAGGVVPHGEAQKLTPMPFARVGAKPVFGVPRSDAARAGGAGVQIVRDWVLRFNAEAAGH